MIFDRELFEEVWEGSKSAWKAFESDAKNMPGYDEVMVKDAFIAGMVTATVFLGHKLLDEGYRQE